MPPRPGVPGAEDEAALRRALAAIVPLDTIAMAAAAERLDRLTKPPGSLGRLEEIVVTLAGIAGRVDAPVARRTVVIAAGDHGVTRQGVSAYPSAVTAQMVANFAAGGAAINVLASTIDAEVVVVDVGVASAVPDASPFGVRGGRLVRARVRDGTRDMTSGPAMDRTDALAAIALGLRLADGFRADGVDLLGVGEMGIGNTTAASAITAVMTGTPPAAVTGRGTGVDDAGWRRKVAAVERAIAINEPRPEDPVGVLTAVGGLEIAMLTGLTVGAAAARIPLVLDGFITTSSALIAQALQPGLAGRLIAGHRSSEPGHPLALDHLGLRPLLDLALRLGEGTGAALAMGLVVAAVRIRDDMATFELAGIAGPTASSQIARPS